MSKEWEYDYECCEFVSPAGERLPLCGLGEFVDRLNALQAVAEAAKAVVKVSWKADGYCNEEIQAVGDYEFDALRTALAGLEGK